MSNGMKKTLDIPVCREPGRCSLEDLRLFSGKSYNLDSLTVGTTEDPTVSRMTIATVSDDETFEQIKKQLNRLVEVIKVIDFTDVFVRMKEILYVKVRKCTPEDKVSCSRSRRPSRRKSSTTEKTACCWSLSRQPPRMTR